MSGLDDIRAECDRIEDAALIVERTMAETDLSADDWRMALGAVDLASREVYRVKKQMLNEAIRRNSADRL